MSPSTESRAPARGLARRLFELTSIVPLSVWVVLHVVEYARSARAPSATRSLELGWSWPVALEALLVWLPLAYHAAYGGLLLLRREPGRGATPSERALDTTERLTGVFLLVALAVHVYRFRLPVLLGERYPEHTGHVLFAELSRTTHGLPLVAAFELALVFAAAFHVAYGCYRLARERVPLGREREPWLRALSLALGVGLSLAGAFAVIRVATGG